MHGDPVQGVDPTGRGIAASFSGLSTVGKIAVVGATAAVGYLALIQAGNVWRFSGAYTTAVNIYVTPLSPNHATNVDFVTYRSYLLAHADEVEQRLEAVNNDSTTFTIIDGTLPMGVEPGYDGKTRAINIPIIWKDGNKVIAQGKSGKLTMWPNAFEDKLQSLQNSGLNTVPINGNTKAWYLANVLMHETAHVIFERSFFRQLFGFRDHTSSGLMEGPIFSFHGLRFNNASQNLLDFDESTKSELRVALGYEWAMW